MIPDYKKIGERIRKERKALDETQDSFAEKHGISRGTVVSWEKGDSCPSLQKMLDLCKEFNCEIGYLLGEYDCKTRQATDICRETGLSEEAVNILIECKRLDDSVLDWQLKTLCDPDFYHDDGDAPLGYVPYNKNEIVAGTIAYKQKEPHCKEIDLINSFIISSMDIALLSDRLIKQKKLSEVNSVKKYFKEAKAIFDDVYPEGYHFSYNHERIFFKSLENTGCPSDLAVDYYEILCNASSADITEFTINKIVSSIISKYINTLTEGVKESEKFFEAWENTRNNNMTDETEKIISEYISKHQAEAEELFKIIEVNHYGKHKKKR